MLGPSLRRARETVALHDCRMPRLILPATDPMRASFYSLQPTAIAPFSFLIAS
jgi:hypothetical protein